MATEINRRGHRLEVVTADRYGNTNTYTFTPCEDNHSIWQPDGDCTLTALEAMWEANHVVEWSLEDLHPRERERFHEKHVE